MSDSGSSETTDRVERVSTRTRVLRPMRHPVAQANIILATRTREGCSAQKAVSGEDRLHAAHGQVAGLWQRPSTTAGDGSAEASRIHSVVKLTRHRKMRSTTVPKRQLTAKQTLTGRSMGSSERTGVEA